MKRIVVCGATGFLGRNIAARLGAMFPGKVLGVWHSRPTLDLDGVSWCHADLCNATDVNELIEAGDVVIQMAAVTSGSKDIVTRPYIHVTDTVIINSLLLRACYDNQARQFIYPGCACFYPPNLGRAATESDAVNEIYENAYFGAGWTKIYIEKMCRFYASLGRTRHIVFRHSNIYGPWDKFSLDDAHMFGATITKVMRAERGGEITIWGSGTESRDLLYVDDLVDFVIKSLNQKEYFDFINVGLGRAITVNEVVDEIIRASGKNLTIRHDLGKPNIPVNIWLDCSKAKDNYGWTSKNTLEEGICKTIEWYRKTYPQNCQS